MPSDAKMLPGLGRKSQLWGSLRFSNKKPAELPEAPATSSAVSTAAVDGVAAPPPRAGFLRSLQSVRAELEDAGGSKPSQEEGEMDPMPW